MSEQQTIQVGKRTYTGDAVPVSTVPEGARRDLHKLRSAGYIFDDRALRVAIGDWQKRRRTKDYSYFIEGVDVKGVPITYAYKSHGRSAPASSTIYVDQKPVSAYETIWYGEDARAARRYDWRCRVESKRSFVGILGLGDKEWEGEPEVQKLMELGPDERRFTNILRSSALHDTWLKRAVAGELFTQPELSRLESYLANKERLERERKTLARLETLYKKEFENE